MDPKGMAEWAYSHACDKCHAGEACEIDACLEAKDVAEFLQRVRRLDTTTGDGERLRGWFVPDRV